MVTQGQNHIDSPANMLQQQHSYEVSEKNIFILFTEFKIVAVFIKRKLFAMRYVKNKVLTAL